MGQASLSMSQVSDDLASLFTYLEIGPFHLVGYSLGGRTALSFSFHYPAYVVSLTLESASPGLKTEQERAERMESDGRLAQRIQDDGVPAFVDYRSEERRVGKECRCALQ